MATGIVCPLVDRKPRVFAEIRANHWTTPADTTVAMADVRRLGGRLCALPEDFELHPRVAKIVEDRRMMAVGAMPVVIEDDVLIGGNCGIYEGTLVRARAVLGAGTILTRSTCSSTSVTATNTCRSSTSRTGRRTSR